MGCPASNTARQRQLEVQHGDIHPSRSNKAICCKCGRALFIAMNVHCAVFPGTHDPHLPKQMQDHGHTHK
eukprot:4818326-Amphidinium_carterae.1